MVPSNTFTLEAEIEGTLFEEDVRIKVIYSKDGTKSYQLGFTIGGFFVYLEQEKKVKENIGQIDSKKALQGTFTGGARNLNIQVTDFLLKRFPDLLSYIPASFIPDISLTDIYICYENNATSYSWTFFLTGQISKQEVRVFFQRQQLTDPQNSFQSSQILFGIGTDFNDFSQLPLVGSEMKEVALTGIGFVYASEKRKYHLPQLETDADNRHFLSFSQQETSFEQGINLVGVLSMPNDPDPIRLNLPINTSSESKQGLNNGSTQKPSIQNDVIPATPVKAVTAGKLFSLNKKLGPITVSTVVVRFESGVRLSLLLTGGVTLGGLSLTADGLGVSFNPFDLMSGKHIDTQFGLEGVSINYQKEPIAISGSFLKVDPSNPDVDIAFSGLAQIKAANFTVSAIGSYERLKNGKDSFFIYGLYNGPIGGPAFFFVTGIAAGFGYNRSVRIPQLQEVKDFPLVRLAMHPTLSDKPDQVLQELENGNWLPASPGDYWLAVGIQFTTFKIIESFVLLTAQFGNQTEFAIIGLSVLKWPSEGTAIAYVELAILARFGPGRDSIEVSGMLTPNSYILSRDCRLTGGFAFYAWVSGEHEGDFVITLGGYHPRFVVPAHYPRVDRIGLNWQLSSNLVIRGEMYFALTPKAVMAGGRWEVEFRLSFLTARLTYWADMIIYWSPFHYEIEGGISVSIEADIKILFIRIHFNLSLGCTLRIWGPPFAGEVYVDWSIFSFTIPFGSSERPALGPIGWFGDNGFLKSFVPKDLKKVVVSKIVAGAYREDSAENKDKIVFVNPYDLVIGVDSFFPLLSLGVTMDDSNSNLVDEKNTLLQAASRGRPMLMEKRTKEFGITPMGITQLHSNLTINLQRTDGKKFESENFGVVGIAKGFNGALWAANINDKETVIKDVLAGAQLHCRVAHPIKPVEIEASYNPPVNFKESLHLLISNLPGDEFSSAKVGIINDANPRTKTLETLKNADFRDLEIDTFSFEDLDIDNPRFWIPIGKIAPAIRIS